VSIFKRRPTQLQQQLAEADRETAKGRLRDALATVQPSLAAQCEHVRTVQGRTAHLDHPEHGVLCGWPGAWIPAGPSLPVCRLCEEKANGISAGEVA
jgi:hypothetical protein